MYLTGFMVKNKHGKIYGFFIEINVFILYFY